MSAPVATRRRGADVLVGALETLGAGAAFGVPGTHALAIWEGLRASPIATLGMRTELSSGFAADGYARASGRPAPLLLSTGPGALQLAHGSDGGRERARPGRRDLEPDPARPDRSQPRLPA